MLTFVFAAPVRMRHAGRASIAIETDCDRPPPYQDIPARGFDGPRERARQPLRAAADEAAARTEIAALGERKEHPPQGIGIVMIVGEIGGERAFDGLVVPEGAREHLAKRALPVAHQRS